MKMLNAALAKVLKRLHYPLEMILTCVRWYVAYPFSLQHLEEMKAERGVSVDHSAGPSSCCRPWRKCFVAASGHLVRSGAWTSRTFASRGNGGIFTGPSTFCYASIGTRLQPGVTLRNRSTRTVHPSSSAPLTATKPFAPRRAISAK
jgi:hypothetical protein